MSRSASPLSPLMKLCNDDRNKNEFLATPAHELRNPLAPISAATELIGRGILDEER